MVYYKKNTNDRGELFSSPEELLFEELVILERSEKIKSKNMVKAVAVIFAICATVAGAVFAKSRFAKKSEA